MMRSLLHAVDFARRYGTAIAAVAITVVVKLLVNGLGEDHPFVLLPVPVAIAAALSDEGLRSWHEKRRAPLRRRELRASEALAALGRGGYRGAASSSLRAVVGDAGLLRRITMGWHAASFPARTDEA